jgi:PEP-CTERM motif
VKKRNQCLLALATLTLVFFCTVPTMAAVVLSTPTGLAPGAKFRYIFLTNGTTTATSTAIGDYNSFVNGDANNATYNGNVVDWRAVGSTSTMDARVNVGGYDTLVPVYLVNGTKVADNLTTTAGGVGLWGGSIKTNVDVKIDGLISDREVFTGSSSDGLKQASHYLGHNVPDWYAQTGLSYNKTYWIDGSFSGVSLDNPMYAVSQELTVVPEPSTYILLTMALGAVGFVRMKMKKTA